MSEIPHPPMVDTMQRLAARAAARPGSVRFIHLNHSTPALHDAGLASHVGADDTYTVTDPLSGDELPGVYLLVTGTKAQLPTIRAHFEAVKGPGVRTFLVRETRGAQIPLTLARAASGNPRPASSRPYLKENRA